MNIKKIDEYAFLKAMNIEKINGKGRRKSELGIKLDEMQDGDCLEITCDNVDEFINARNIVAMHKGRSKKGQVSYSASKKQLTIVVRKNEL